MSAAIDPVAAGLSPAFGSDAAVTAATTDTDSVQATRLYNSPKFGGLGRDRNTI